MADINKLLSDKAITQEQNKVRILNVLKKYSSSSYKQLKIPFI